MISLKPLVHAKIAYVAVERLIFVSSADPAFFAVVGIIFKAGEMFAKYTKVGRHFGCTA